jgi:hypothetical protein
MDVEGVLDDQASHAVLGHHREGDPHDLPIPFEGLLDVVSSIRFSEIAAH